MTRSRKAKPVRPKKSGKARKRAARFSKPKLPAKTVERLDWRGITVSVSYEPNWPDAEDRFPLTATAHMEIKAVSPSGALLPITETGYRSHFLAPGVAERAGGPVTYVRAWLDEAAKSPDWKRKEFASRQLCLF